MFERAAQLAGAPGHGAVRWPGTQVACCFGAWSCQVSFTWRRRAGERQVRWADLNFSRMDPHERLDAGEKAAREHRYEEALNHYIWFHDHALEHDEALYGVRLSFALAYWTELGEVYPPALDVLKEIRDRKTKLLLEGAGNRHLFNDVEAINQHLHEDEATSRLFRQLSVKMPGLAKQCADIAMPALVKSKAYELARAFVENPEEMIRGWSSHLNEEIAKSETKPETRAPLREAYTRIYTENVHDLLEVLIGMGEAREATPLRDIALAAVTDTDVRKAVEAELSNLPLP